jgi:hypothetical protein
MFFTWAAGDEVRLGYKVKVLALSILWAATLISATASALSPRDQDPRMALLFIAIFIMTEAVTLACRGELLKRLSNTRAARARRGTIWSLHSPTRDFALRLQVPQRASARLFSTFFFRILRAL